MSSDCVLECICEIESIDLLLIFTHSQLQKSTYDIKCLIKNVRSMNFDDISKHILLKCNTIYSLSALLKKKEIEKYKIQCNKNYINLLYLHVMTKLDLILY